MSQILQFVTVLVHPAPIIDTNSNIIDEKSDEKLKAAVT